MIYFYVFNNPDIYECWSIFLELLILFYIKGYTKVINSLVLCVINIFFQVILESLDINFNTTYLTLKSIFLKYIAETEYTVEQEREHHIHFVCYH